MCRLLSLVSLAEEVPGRVRVCVRACVRACCDGPGAGMLSCSCLNLHGMAWRGVEWIGVECNGLA